MKRFFTPYVDKTEKEEQTSFDEKAMVPSLSTLEFLKQFARAYHVAAQKDPELCSFVLN